jgi:ubiquinone/menaquinone biosynthesis methyltransferase
MSDFKPTPVVPQPTAFKVRKQSRVMEVSFDDGGEFSLPFELMRVYSPSAEVRGHAPGQETLQLGKRDVEIVALEPVGNYGVKPIFSDGHDSGEVWLTDINESMLRVGRDRLLNNGIATPSLLCDAEKLPFPDNYFDRVTVAFGLRNMTHKDQALAEMQRVLKPGGKLLVLEFSKVWKPLQKPYDVYSFSVLPWLGKRIANDADSYRYLAESIRMHPDQDVLKQMLVDAGLERVEYFNLTAGVAALHTGVKL